MSHVAMVGSGARAFPSPTPEIEGVGQQGLGAPGSRWLHYRRRDGQCWRRTPPPPYERKRLPEIAPRDRLWRRDAHIAIDDALRAGELTLHEAAVLRAVLSFSDDTGQVIFAGQVAIAQAAGWESDRTVRRWMRAAEASGWVAVEHRCDRRADGTVIGLTNLTVVQLPAEVEIRRLARKAAGKGHATPRAPQNRPHVPHGGLEDRRPTPPMRTPHDATAVVLPDLPAPATAGLGAAFAERALRRARGSP